MAEPQTSEPRHEAGHWLWVLVALGSHTGWGAYPVLARYLQTVSNLPSMSLLAVGNLAVLLVLARFIPSHFDSSLLRSHLIWLLMFTVCGRAITNMLAPRFALAIYVQLITLSTPFLVVLLGKTLFREPIPPYTGHAITFSLIGSLLMMSSGNGPAGLLQFAPTSSDWLGIGIAVLSSVFLALYMLTVRRSAQQQHSGEAVFAVQVITVTIISTILSLLLREDWSRWATLGLTDWLVFALFAGGVFLGANIGNFIALRRLGAPFVSSLLGWRLVITLLFGGLLLGERLTTPWQFLGALIVLLTISWYVRRTTTAKPATPAHRHS
jgi:drug/metabolite transporter (DMT)-like permease